MAVLGACAILYPPAMRSKLGRWLSGVSVLRVVNLTSAQVKDVRLSYTRNSSTALNYEEVGNLAPGEVREVNVRAETLTGGEIVYGFSGEVRTKPIAEHITAGSIIEIQIVSAGWIKTLATH